LLVSKSKFYWYPIILIYCCIVTLYLGTAYSGGDKLVYNYLYEHLSDISSLPIGYLKTFQAAGASEPLFFLLYFISSKFIPKIIFDFILNLALIFVLFELNNQYSRYKNISMIALLTNFYTFVLLLPGEKLKIAFLTFLLLIVLGRHKIFTSLVVSSFFHFQFFINALFSIKKDLFKLNFISVLLFSIVLIGLLLLGTKILDKILFYMFRNDNIIIDILKIGFWGFLALIISKRSDKNLLYTATIVLILVSIALGSDRLVIVIYSIYFFIAIKSTSKISISIFALAAVYYAMKSVFFILAILRTGDGFNY